MSNVPVTIEQGVIRVVGCAFIVSVLSIVVLTYMGKAVPTTLDITATGSMTGLLAIFSPTAARSAQNAQDVQSSTIVTTSSTGETSEA